MWPATGSDLSGGRGITLGSQGIRTGQRLSFSAEVDSRAVWLSLKEFMCVDCFNPPTSCLGFVYCRMARARVRHRRCYGTTRMRCTTEFIALYYVSWKSVPMNQICQGSFDTLCCVSPVLLRNSYRSAQAWLECRFSTIFREISISMDEMRHEDAMLPSERPIHSGVII